MSSQRQIGTIGVDAGLCWIGDPCYILHKEEPAGEIGKSWKEFCDMIDHDSRHTQFNYRKGHPGLGVCVQTGYGDGTYPVFAEFNSDGVLARVIVDFDHQEYEYDKYEGEE